MGGIQFLLFEETNTGRIILDSREVYPYQIPETRKTMESMARTLRKHHPDKRFGWQQFTIDNLPPGAAFQ